MRVTLWGTRGSLATPGPETTRYGGNTACVEVRGPNDTLLVLDAGTGIRRLGATLPPSLARIDILLTHLHLDHIQGLGFFAPLYDPDTEVHLWGPASARLSLRTRLNRYLSPPLFPVLIRDLPNPDRVFLHDISGGNFQIGEFEISAAYVCHPGPTVGYRIAGATGVLAYLPDHEPALGVKSFPQAKEWTSGYSIAAGADLLIHDAQYSEEEYEEHFGWGHSSWPQALAFAALAGVKHFVPFHHDPAHSDDYLDAHTAQAIAAAAPRFFVTPGREGEIFNLGRAHLRQEQALYLPKSKTMEA